MKTFEVEGWYRYADNEKDFELWHFDSETAEGAIEQFKNRYGSIRFFKIYTKEIL